jgi:hypothetical protein
MANELVEQSKNQIKHINVSDRKGDILFVDEKFKISETVNKLHKMMTEVTKEDFSAKNVNAACHCISQLNATINTVIGAARFLRDG